jgi:hypothetical protein
VIVTEMVKQGTILRVRAKNPMREGGRRKSNSPGDEDDYNERNPWRINLKNIVPEKFDGSAPLQSFLKHFSTCASHNRWDDSDKLAYLRMSLRGGAAQFVDAGDDCTTYDQLGRKLKINLTAPKDRSLFIVLS